MKWIEESPHLIHAFDEEVHYDPYAIWDGVSGDVIRVERHNIESGASLTLSFYKIVNTKYWLIYNHLTSRVKFYVEDLNGNDAVEKRYMPITGFSPVSPDDVFDSSADESLINELIYIMDKLR